MSSNFPEQKTRGSRKWPKRLLIGLVFLGVVCIIYVCTHPLVFNESFFSHAHCMPQAAGALLQYAVDHNGKFPVHTNGYGDALLLLVPDYTPWSILTGPGYDSDADKQWKQNGTSVPESECGRIYVQGLSETNNAGIVILYDKTPTPGGDHCHGLKRLHAPLCRDVLFLDGRHDTILESKWLEFAKNQIELLVKEGFDQATAEALYAEKGKEH